MSFWRANRARSKDVYRIRGKYQSRILRPLYPGVIAGTQVLNPDDYPPAEAEGPTFSVNGVSTYTSINGVSSFTSVNGVT